ncbi:MATE family efflux transporter [Brucepastera parasyntrophica]|uniref:MATE family efflux transporter n=1 Tax=Brucepastera parasyntrophica TaxID=2880008 RepID=UPI00210E78BE|nr:MATE family efflux transporter [Brucepastera parasyntrophica]ULQ60990.1 MATE family efflux transporter [Brucepastera parasyntrophica]
MNRTQVLDKNISFGMLIRFSLPTIASMIFMSIYSSVDGVFVSRLVGTSALSAVNLIMPLIMFSMAIGTMFGSGGNALVAKLIGEGREQRARQIFSLLIAVAFGVSLLLSVFGLIFINPLLRFLGADESLFVYCADYARPVLILMPFSVFGMIFQMSFITVGKPHLGLIVSVLGGVTNIILDYVFIALFGMGVRGAAIATGIGYSIPALIGLLYFAVNRKDSLYLVKPVPDLRAVWKSCSNGASEMVTSLSASVVALLLNNILMRMAGSDGVASITIIMYAQGILSAAYMGYSIGISPLISYNYGKQDSFRLKKIYSLSLNTILAASVITFALSLLLADILVGIFVPRGTAVYDMAVRGYRIFAVAFLFMGFNGFSSALFTALNNGKVSAILSFFRTLIFIVAAVLTLPLILGVTGVWLAIPLAEVLGVVMTIYYFRKMKPVYQYA